VTGRRPGAPLRVAVLITRLEGGAGRLALHGATALAPGKFRVTLITGSGDHLLAQAAAAGLEVICEPSLRAPIRAGSDLRALRWLGGLLRERPFDVVHTHTAKAGALGRLAAHRAGVPRIVHTYHGFPFHQFQSAARRAAYVAAERRLGRITDVTLCVGAGVAAEAIRRGLAAPARVRTIGVVVPGAGGPGPEGPGLPALGADARRRARALLGLPQEARVVGAVGRLAYQKAPEDFVAALRRLDRPGVVGVWVGGGELAARVSRLAGRPGPRMVLAGERLDVPQLLPAFDVFALPSRYEGLPTAVVEAMACGVPVVATAVNAVSDVVVPGETGLLVPPQRPDLLAAAVAYLLDTPAAAARMASSARARLSGRFGIAALREALTCAYISLSIYLLLLRADHHIVVFASPCVPAGEAGAREPGLGSAVPEVPVLTIPPLPCAGLGSAERCPRCPEGCQVPLMGGNARGGSRWEHRWNGAVRRDGPGLITTRDGSAACCMTWLIRSPRCPTWWKPSGRIPR
jgi:glycosyltransferase involved in cell wall biosynthesis